MSSSGSLLLTLLFFPLFTLGQTTRIDGLVVNKTNNEPVPFARVVIQGTTTGAYTSEEGKFSLGPLDPGLYNVEVNSLGFLQAIVYEVEVTVDRPGFVTVLLEEVKTELAEVEIRGSTQSNKEESPVSVRTIGTNEIKRNAGGNRDISKVIRTLPGVAAIPSFRNDIIIRGGAASENRFYIDGIEIPTINHFSTQGASGGPVGLINVDLISEVEFYSGAFPAARGNALSSVLAFEFRDGRTDKFSANLVAGSSDLGLTLEGPTGKNSSLLLSVRRSYLQALFALLELPFLPTYNDYNIKWKWNIDERNKLTLLSLGALDDFDINLDLSSDSTSENFDRNRYLLDNLVINKQWNYTIGGQWDHYRDNGRWTLVASRNMLQNDAFKYEQNDQSLPRTFDYTSREQENKLRVEYTRKVGDWNWLAGAGYERARYSNSSLFQEYIPALDSALLLTYQSSYSLNKYGAFFQFSRRMLKERLVLSGGLRTDGSDLSTTLSNLQDQLSPRLSLSYALSPEWSLNANTGIYYQLPSYLALGYKEGNDFVNTDMRYIRNSQVVAGIRYNMDERNSTLSLEGFWKKYSNYPLSVNKGISLANLGADFGTVGNEDLLSIGLGRAYGLELLFQQKLYKGYYGIVAYTYVRSEFTGLSGGYIPSSWDSRHLISMTGGKKLKRNWEVGAVFRLSGGLPYTPDLVDESIRMVNWDALRFAQPDWSKLNSERIGTFHQLDVRVDKKWFFARWSLDLFLDIQNIYNSSTPLKPTLDVKRNGNGVPIPDPDRPGYYLPNFLDESSSNILPSIGIIIEL